MEGEDGERCVCGGGGGGQTLSKTQTRQNDNYSKTDVDKDKHKGDGAKGCGGHISLKENIAKYSHTDIDNQADKHKQKLTGWIIIVAASSPAVPSSNNDHDESVCAAPNLVRRDYSNRIHAHTHIGNPHTRVYWLYTIYSQLKQITNRDLRRKITTQTVHERTYNKKHLIQLTNCRLDFSHRQVPEDVERNTHHRDDLLTHNAK